MRIERFDSSAPEPWPTRLQEFEREFRYPLGPGRTFRIDHGEEYTRFYRALGPASCFVAATDGEIAGVASVAIRSVSTPSGLQDCAYVGDTKIRSSIAGARALHGLLRAVHDWVIPRVTCAYAITMDGSDRTPADYTGRLGVPPFVRLGEIVIYRIPCTGALPTLSAPNEIEAPESRLSQAGGAPRSARALVGDSSARSQMPVERLVVDDASAVLEDTRNAKQLFDDRGVELRSAHLSDLEFASPSAARALLEIALAAATTAGHDHLFLSVPEGREREIAALLDFPGRTRAPASVYGVGFPADLDWNINPAEI